MKKADKSVANVKNLKPQDSENVVVEKQQGADSVENIGISEEEIGVESVKESKADEKAENSVSDNSSTDESADKNLLEEKPGEKTKKEKVKETVKKYCKRYFIDAFTGMAQGLFVTLIAGTILAQVASWFGDNTFAKTLGYIASIAKMLMGAGIGVGIAHKLGAKPLVMFTAAVSGLLGAWAMPLMNYLVGSTAAFALPFGAPGNPIGSYVLSLFTVEIAGLYAGKTKLDIILVPIGMLLLGFVGIFVAWPFIKLIDLFAQLIVILIKAGEAVKIIVGIVVAVVMGILLTMPTSSAAIWIAIAGSSVGLANPDVFAIAGGAAVAGCAAHMVGFAVTSFRENKISGLISQGIGTSMLQIPNIMRKPIIMVPQIISSAVSGFIAVIMGLRCNAAGGGMGTSGLVGIFGAIEASQGIIPAWQIALAIILCMFVIPIGVGLLFSELFRKKGLIKFGDMALDK
ncbi:MAG: PTS transporter subunit IIC [Christensenellales bacterium]